MNDIHLVQAYVQIKRAYALANGNQGELEPAVYRAIQQVSDEILSGKSEMNLSSDSLLSFSGININTNINQTIACRVEKVLDCKPGKYQLTDIEKFVNLNQESAFVYSLASQLAILLALSKLEIAILNLERFLRRESLTLARVLKVSFTLADPATTGEWGKRLNVFAAAVETVLRRLKDSAAALLDQNQENLYSQENVSAPNLNITEQAQGKSQSSPVDIDKLMLSHLSRQSGFKLKDQDNVWQTTFMVSDLLSVGAALKDLAFVLNKLAAVVRMVGSIDINDAAQSSHTSQMHALVADEIKLAALQGISQNLSLTFLAQCEQLAGIQLMPVLGDNLLNTIKILEAAVQGFTEKGLLSVE